MTDNVLEEILFQINVEDKIILKRDENINRNFKEYASELTDFIINNKATRKYKEQSLSTDVISLITQITIEITKPQSDKSKIEKYFSTIAQKLLDKEIEAQKRIDRMDGQIKKGNLFLSILREKNNFLFIISKTNNTDFIDDSDLKEKQGFPSKKYNSWKTTIFTYSLEKNNNILIKEIQVRLDNFNTKYWCNEFLEIIPMLSDEDNTSKAFTEIDKLLKNKIKKIAPLDYSCLRNSFMGKLRKKDTLIDYPNMVTEVVDNYQPIVLAQEKLESLKKNLYELPESKEFDSQFYSKPEKLDPKIKTQYPLSAGITLAVDDNSGYDKIIPEEIDGKRYIRIQVTDNESYNTLSALKNL